MIQNLVVTIFPSTFYHFNSDYGASLAAHLVCSGFVSLGVPDSG